MRKEGFTESLAQLVLDKTNVLSLNSVKLLFLLLHRQQMPQLVINAGPQKVSG